MFRRHSLHTMTIVAAVASFSGCLKQAPTPAPPPPPEVQVSKPVIRSVRDYEDFTGRTEAAEAVEIRARVTGYLEETHFKEGMDVKKGDLLFKIDPRPYQAAMDRAEAALRQAQTRFDRLTREFERGSTLRRKGVVSQEEFEKLIGDRDEAESAVGLEKANVELAKLNLDFTTVRSPITGRISQRFVDPGNLVKADETALTNIVSIDPIHANFDMDERTMLRIRRLVDAGTIKSVQEPHVQVMAALTDEDDFSHVGFINFMDNQVENSTGTLRVRGEFPNPKGLISSGMFVRVRLPLGEPSSALLIVEQAISTDQGQKYVYVINEKNEAVYRRVKVGRLAYGMRVIQEGLTAEDQVVVNGLQRILPGLPVTPKPMPMPIPETAEKGDGTMPAETAAE